MKKIIIAFSLILLCFGVGAQTFNQTFSNDKVQIKELSHKQGLNYKIKNYDSDNYWSKADNNLLINFNDSLEIVNSLRLPNTDYRFKYGNKLFLLSTTLHYEYDTSFNQILVLDSISLIYYDIETELENYINIEDSLIELNNKYIFLEDSKEIAVISSPRIDLLDSNSITNSMFFKVAILDTLGNTLRYKKIKKKLHDFSIEEQGNNIIISSRTYESSSMSSDYMIYLVDKSSLCLVDSISTDKHYLYLKTIDDSLILGITGLNNIHVDIYNTRDKTVINNVYSISYPTIHWSNQYFQNTYLSIDFIDKDSIFFACQLRDGNPYNSHGIEIFNFRRDGSLNYRYMFNDYQPSHHREVNGITAIRNGDLIIDVMSIINYEFSNAWLLKYSNYGGSNLYDISYVNNSITLYPNPTNSEVNISSESLINSIEIYNSLGQMVYTETINSKEKTIDISSLPSGVYVLGAKTENGIMRKKIIKN